MSYEKAIKPGAAKKILAAELEQRGLGYTKLTARTIGFDGFGYGAKVFVKAHGLKAEPSHWEELVSICHQNGFILEGGSAIA